MNKRSRLFFQDVELGEVEEENSDFPNLFGIFYPNNEAADSPLRRELQRYIAYSIAADKLTEEGREEEWEIFMSENEAQFSDFIETDDWCLLDGDRKRLILIPNFCQDAGVIWRWNIIDSH